MEKYAYARVSTKEQNIDRQIAALEPYDVPKHNIFCDYQSGKDFCRPEYQKMLKRIKRGDLILVKSIDRLGRNYNEILKQWQFITKELQADIVVLDMELLDTRTTGGSITGTFIADLVLQIMAYFAQAERDSIHQRQAEGIAAAKAKGKHFGRTPTALPDSFESVCVKCQNRALSTRQAAAKLNMCHSTFYRHFVKWKGKKAVFEGRQFGTV